jgi:hypothetical protein
MSEAEKINLDRMKVEYHAVALWTARVAKRKTINRDFPDMTSVIDSRQRAKNRRRANFTAQGANCVYEIYSKKVEIRFGGRMSWSNAHSHTLLRTAFV